MTGSARGSTAIPIDSSHNSTHRQNNHKRESHKREETLVQQLLPLLGLVNTAQPNETQRWICLVEVSPVVFSLVLFFSFLF